MTRTLYDPDVRDDVMRRLSGLEPSNARQWGTMTIAQMLAHCSADLEVPCGDRVEKQALLAKVVAPLALRRHLGKRPPRRNLPTTPERKIVDDRDFATERQRLTRLVERFCDGGPSAADGVVHAFFGHLTGQQWGLSAYKHLDHHLRQFSA